MFSLRVASHVFILVYAFELGWQIKFFLKTGSTSAPTTEAEKLRWSVLEAERPSIR